MVHSRKAEGLTTMGWLGMAIIVLVTVGVLLYAFLPRIMQTADVVNCNNAQQRCACFYRGNVCPDQYVSRDTNSRSCPADNVQGHCSDDNYDSLLHAARDASSGDANDPDNDGNFGTCCQGLPPGTRISNSRLWNPPTPVGEMCGGSPCDNGVCVENQCQSCQAGTCPDGHKCECPQDCYNRQCVSCIGGNCPAGHNCECDNDGRNLVCIDSNCVPQQAGVIQVTVEQAGAPVDYLFHYNRDESAWEARIGTSSGGFTRLEPWYIDEETFPDADVRALADRLSSAAEEDGYTMLRGIAETSREGISVSISSPPGWSWPS